MGVQSTDIFENDAAFDWLCAFGENDFRLIDRTLAGAANLMEIDELETDEACEVLVAAECIAAACGFPAHPLPDTILNWVRDNSPMQVKQEYVEMAKKAVWRVWAKSDLRDLWAATEKFREWETAVANLHHRLMQIPLKQGV